MLKKKHSNTTLVKVKFATAVITGFLGVYSNTTLVKVKSVIANKS